MGRKDFTWSEAASLVHAFHKMMQDRFGVPTPGRVKNGWSIQDTSKELGLNPSDTVYYLKLHEGVQADPDLIHVKQKSKALTKMKRSNRQLAADLLNVKDFNEAGVTIKCGDSKKVLAELDDDIKFNLIITDPPWGINFEDRISDLRKESLPTTYDKDYNPMDTVEILSHAYKHLHDNCPIYMFYSAIPEKILEGQKLLLASGFSIEIIPLIWYKKHVLAHDARETRHGLNYEIILYGWKGDRPLLSQPARNVFEQQVAFLNRIHASEKPEALLVQLINLHTKEGDNILDPFGGSCMVADACRNTNRKCLVVELDPGLVKMASLRVWGV
jgi:hypothetical protein